MIRKPFYALMGMIFTFNLALAHAENAITPENRINTEVSNEWKLVSVINETEIYFALFELDGDQYLKIKVINVSGNKTGQMYRLYLNSELVIFSDDGAEGMYVELQSGESGVFGERVLIPFSEGSALGDYQLTIKSN